MGCAAFYRDWHISGHTHRQNICFDAYRIQLSQQPLHGMKLTAQLIVAAVGLGHTHQSAHFNIRQLGHFKGQRNRLIGRYAVFRFFCGNVHFNAHLQRRHFRRPLFAQAPRRFQTAYRMHPMCALGHKFGFIRLHITDNVPNNIRQIGQRFRFFKPFLNIVLAEIALTGRIHFADIVCRKRLADRYQLHRTRRPSGSLSRLFKRPAYVLIVLLQYRHGFLL